MCACCDGQCRVVPCRAVSVGAARCRAALYHAVLCHVVPCSAVPYHAVRCACTCRDITSSLQRDSLISLTVQVFALHLPAAFACSVAERSSFCQKLVSSSEHVFATQTYRTFAKRGSLLGDDGEGSCTVVYLKLDMNMVYPRLRDILWNYQTNC